MTKNPSANPLCCQKISNCGYKTSLQSRHISIWLDFQLVFRSKFETLWLARGLVDGLQNFYLPHYSIYSLILSLSSLFLTFLYIVRLKLNLWYSRRWSDPVPAEVKLGCQTHILGTSTRTFTSVPFIWYWWRSPTQEEPSHYRQRPSSWGAEVKPHIPQSVNRGTLITKYFWYLQFTVLYIYENLLVEREWH